MGAPTWPPNPQSSEPRRSRGAPRNREQVRRTTMAQTTIGVLHPGEMGSVVAACARHAGARVVWASAGRRSATRERATAAGLEDVGTLRDLVALSDVILSVCPPES